MKFEEHIIKKEEKKEKEDISNFQKYRKFNMKDVREVVENRKKTSEEAIERQKERIKLLKEEEKKGTLYIKKLK